MRVLLTGASGFVGQALYKELVNQGIHCIPVLRKTTETTFVQRYNPEKVFSIEKMCAETNWDTVLGEVDAIIHAAARVHIMQDTSTDPLAAFRSVNVDATRSLAVKAAKSGVKRFVYISSIKVNGESTPYNKPFTVNDIPNPQDPYAVSKYEAEVELIKIARETGMEVVIIRPPLVYGPHVKANFQSMMNWLSKGVPLPFASISNKRSMVSVINLVDLIITCLSHPKAKNNLFLISDDQDMSTPQLLRAVADGLNVPARLISLPSVVLKLLFMVIGKKLMYSRLTDSLQVDLEHTRKQLGWTPKVSVEFALKGTARAFLEEK